MTACGGADVYIVDVCGTLVRDDTTLGLLSYHFGRDRARPLRRWVFNSVSTRWSPLWFAFAVAERLTGRHLLKHFVLRLLSGDRLENLESNAREYAQHLLSNRCVPTVWTLLEQPLSSGRVLLASASLEPVVSALAVSTGAGYVASTLEHREGVLTGRYEVDLTGKKSQALVDKYGSEVFLGKVCVFTDNYTDRSLVEDAESCYIILHDPAHRKRWDGVDATFLGVNE
ncbi:haloacid dehalogenase-like hydrolase [Halomonas sp. RA08-2]|uniref:haloacid dehalogenase-like hydrolase n=1 Tax=Halomonas sp. RA08-2 TaxID=3440842 RepID=UPI003EEE58C3